ncbi:MAG: tRNA (adenosine(37)-N6)-threonylcarbamoyltransferase complex dimerization subunit type 1 TsaB [Coriobacteriia bacterium]
MRPLLAFDTSTDHLAIGVGDLDRPGDVLAAADMAAPRAANTMLLSAVERVLAEAGLVPSSLAAVACGRGPGSFTGVRIGVATAKGLAHGAGVPLTGFSTLDGVAWRVWRSGEHGARTRIGILGDAMRGEVYPALFEVTPYGVKRIAGDRVAAPLAIAEEWAPYGDTLVLAGGALTKHRAIFQDVCGGSVRIASDSVWTPDGTSLLDAAWAASGPSTVREIVELGRTEAYRHAHPGALLPVYTRLSDAEEAERRISARAVPSAAPPSGVVGPERGDR